MDNLDITKIMLQRLNEYTEAFEKSTNISVRERIRIKIETINELFDLITKSNKKGE